MLIAFNYHYIRENFDEPFPSIFGVTPKEFEQELDQIGKSAVFLSQQDIIDIIDNKKDLPNRAAVITFDDGFKEQFELAYPILKRKGIPAIFFVTTKPIECDYVTETHKIHLYRAHTSSDKLIKIKQEIMEKNSIEFELPSYEEAKNVYQYDEKDAAQLKFFLNHKLTEQHKQIVINKTFSLLEFDERQISNQLYMTKEMLKVLADDGMLGTHGHTHKPLGLLEPEKAIDDVSKSIIKLKKWTNKMVKSLSYPFGYKKACCTSVARFIEKKGLKFAFTMERAGNKYFDNPFFLARLSNSDIPKNATDEIMEKFWKNLKPSKWYK